MDREIEELIVKSFFANRFQDRILFELGSQKKRRLSISRLSHNYSNILDNKFINEIPKPNSNIYDIAKLLKEQGAGNQCYCISFNEEIDGRSLSLISALEIAVGYGMPSLISCIPGKLAYFEAEQELGAPPRYILKK